VTPGGFVSIAGGTLLCVLVAGVSSAQTLVGPPEGGHYVRVAVAEETAGEGVRLLESADVRSVRLQADQALPIAVRIQLTDLNDPTVETRLAALERRGTPLWLAVSPPDTSAAVDDWRRGLRAIAGRRTSTLAILEIVIDRQPAAVAVFALQAASTDTRARRSAVQGGGVQIALGGEAGVDAGRRAEIYTAATAPYIDLAVTSDAALPALLPWLRQTDPGARVAILSQAAAGDPIRRVIDEVLADVGTDVVVRAWRAADITAAALAGLAPLKNLLTGDLQPLDEAAVRVSLTADGRDITAGVRHRLLFDTRTFSTYLLYWGEPAPAPMRVTLTLPIEGRPGIRDLVAGARPAAEGYTRDAATGRVQLDVPRTGRPMLVDFNEEVAEVMADRGAVTAERQLSVAEIIARHQQTQAAQDAVVRNYSASARMRQHFRPTITDPGYDVVTENRYFVEGSAVEWEQLSFSVNGSRWGDDPPPFPLLQPEKVLSLPLQLRFDEGYRYELDGTERVDGFDCYVVRFEPARADSSLYKGRVWIDRRTFARIQVRAVQSGLPAPIVSTEETLHYVHAGTIDNQPVFLFGGSTARQILLMAGRNLLIEKDVTFSGFVINDPAFEGSRTEARRGDRIMYRETERGLRYYVKQGDERVISENPTSRVKAMAMGVYLDPSYAFPLPIFGINYLNFGLGGSDQSQLALLFGGVLIAGNIQRPRLGSTPFDASVDFFAIAAPSSDRLYRAGGEAEDERVLTWPMSTGLNVGWQATPYQKATIQYQLRGDFYIRDRTTAVTFVPPSSTVTNGIGGAWEYRRGGYSVLLNGTWFARSRWSAWGHEASPTAPDASKTYVKYGAGVSRTMLVGPFQTVYVNANWFGGRDLDRFVQYQFGMFEDTRIHGVPASGVRFGELAMVRGAYSLNIFEQYRLDLFVEHAWGRDNGRRAGPIRPADSDTSWQRIPAAGMAVNFRTFWNTILRAEVGHSLLPSRYDGLGSTTLQILLLKPLK
jgi:hypothetical protein